MGKILVIAEKPSVGMDIARTLHVTKRADGYVEGNEYIVTWAVGHLVALCDPDGVDPAYKKWSMDTLPMLPQHIPLRVIPSGEKQFKIIKQLMNSREVDSLICATDSGREGELIFRYIYEYAKCRKPFQRLWISSMTEEAIREGFDNLRPGSDYDKLYMSAKCRSEADWLVGMNASRAFSLKYNALLSLGRVQTPTLALVVKRDKEISEFVPEKYFEVKARFAGGPAPGEYEGAWWDIKAKSTRFKTADAAREVVQAALNQPGTVERVDKTEASIPPPYLYDLTTLQRDVNRLIGLSAKQTLDVVQSLYEKHKLVTYPRTDSRHLPHDMIPQVKSVLGTLPAPYAELTQPLLPNISITKRVFDDSKISDHHAIIPTRRNPDTCSMSRDEARVYDLIARRIIAVFYKPYRYIKQEVITRCAGHAFISKGTAPLDWGWKVVYRGIEKEDSEPKLPEIKQSEVRTAAPVKAVEKQTQPPNPLTDASLLSAMENVGRAVEDESTREALKDSGLGTPATRAATIERLLSVGYAERVGKSIRSTAKAGQLMQVLPQELRSAETTGKWERALNRIAKGEGSITPEAFIDSIQRFSTYLVDSARRASQDVHFAPEPARGPAPKPKGRALAKVKCPLCGGKIYENERAFGCENWRTGCKFTIWKDALLRQGLPDITGAVAQKLMLGNTVELGGHRVRFDGTRPVISDEPDTNIPVR